jgi:GDP-L-fucose synthase
MSEFWNGKRVLVTGGTGTIGTPLVHRLISLGVKPLVVSLDSDERARLVLGSLEFFRRGDLRQIDVCEGIVQGMDYVFHLVAVKGSTTVGFSRVASAYIPFLLTNTNMMEAAFRAGIKRYMFVGSIGQYPNLPVRHEDDVWKGPPEANDRFMGIAKRAGEAQAEAYLHEFGWDAVRIVRLSNVFGPFDDFDPATAHVIPALISKMVQGPDPVPVWGNGTAVRDFIYSEDVVDGMVLAMEKAPPCYPINLGAGVGYTIREVAETIASLVPEPRRIAWDVSKPTGDMKRVLDTHRAQETLGFRPRTSLRDGIRRTIEWYLANRAIADRRGRELHG